MQSEDWSTYITNDHITIIIIHFYWSYFLFNSTFSFSCSNNELLEQLRSVPIPREAHSLDDFKRLRGKKPPHLRWWWKYSRLVARGRSLFRNSIRIGCRTVGRNLLHRRRFRKDQPGNRRHDLLIAWPAASREGATPPIENFRPGPSRSWPQVCNRLY